MQQADVVGDFQLSTGLMPTGAVEDKDGVAARGYLSGDFHQVFVHGFGVGAGQDKGGADVAGRANRAENIGPLIARVLGSGGSASLFRPNVGQPALLSDARLVLPP